MKQTYTLVGNPLREDLPLGFSGEFEVNGKKIKITPDMYLADVVEALNSADAGVIAKVSNGALVLESKYASKEIDVRDVRGEVARALGLVLKGATSSGATPPVSLTIYDSLGAEKDGMAPIAFPLTINSTNDTMNIYLSGAANDGVSEAHSIKLTHRTYNNINELVTELQQKIDAAFGKNKIVVSVMAPNTLRLSTYKTGSEVQASDLAVGGVLNGVADTASGPGVLNLIPAGNPYTVADRGGRDGNDKFYIDLGPLAQAYSDDDPQPQLVDLRGGTYATVNDLVDEINYQIMQNPILRKSVSARVENGKIVFETAGKGRNVGAEQLLLYDYSTTVQVALPVIPPNTLENLGITFGSVYYQGTGPIGVMPAAGDQFTVDLGPSATADGSDPPPQVITLSGGYATINDLVDDINSQFDANPYLRGNVRARVGWFNGVPVVKIETTKLNDEVEPADFTLTDGAGTPLADMNIDPATNKWTERNPVRYLGTASPGLNIVAGVNDSFYIDVSPFASKDGRDLPPIQITIPAGVYPSVSALATAIQNAIDSVDELNGVISVKRVVVNGAEVLSFETVKKGSHLKGSDFLLYDAVPGTLGNLAIPPTPTDGSGSTEGESEFKTPSNLIHTMLELRNDLLGLARYSSESSDLTNSEGENLGLIPGDVITITANSTTMELKVTGTTTLEDIVRGLQSALGSNARVWLTSEGSIAIENYDTNPISNFSVEAVGEDGTSRDKFNELFSNIQTVIPPRATVYTKIFKDPTRFHHISTETLGWIDDGIEHITLERSVVGARSNRLNRVLTISDNLKTRYVELKSQVEDANLADLAVLISQEETALQAALEMGAKILPPSLLNYLE